MRLIDVDKIVFYTPKWCDDEGLFTKWLKETLKNAPTVDAVPVIRCKDCNKHDTSKCAMAYWDMQTGEITAWNRPYEFCSRAERKEK